jgi:type II secretory pathway component PulK
MDKPTFFQYYAHREERSDVAISKKDSCHVRRNMARRGFSLIEVLMAMALVFFLLTGMAELLLRSIQAKKAADEHLQRAGLLSSKLESFKALPYESEGLRAGEYQEEIGGAPDEAAALAEWRIEDRGLNSKRIDLRISLQSRPERRLRAVLLVSGFLGFCP